MGAGPIGAHLAAQGGSGAFVWWVLTEALAFGAGIIAADYVFNHFLGLGERYPRPLAGEWKLTDFAGLAAGIAAATLFHQAFWAAG